MGTDRVRDPARIAAVIADTGADVIALQELDVGRRRSGFVDQAAEIARLLRMEHHFAPVREVDDGRYGNAIVSRWPLRVVRAAPLPSLTGREPRGALWTAITLPSGGALQVITTHLGLTAAERRLQVEALLGWRPAAGPLVLCGDLNALPFSHACRRFGSCLRRARPAGWRPAATFPSWLPILPLDHVHATPEVGVLEVAVVATPRARRASDHLPLVALLGL